MRFLLTVITAFLFTVPSLGQGNVFFFFEYDIKSGMEDQFANGYAKDLEWHASQEDDWSWIGWFIQTGDRRGRFIDASPDHEWADSDRWKVNGAENARHNKIHWVPYVENYGGSYQVVLPSVSRLQPDWYLKKILQVYHVEVRSETEFSSFLTAFKKHAASALGDIPFVWMKTVSGGSVSHYQLFVALDKVAQFSQCENLFVFADSQLSESYRQAVSSSTSEMWRLNERLTLVAK